MKIALDAITIPLAGAAGGAVQGALVALVSGKLGEPLDWRSTAKAGALVGAVSAVVLAAGSWALRRALDRAEVAA